MTEDETQKLQENLMTAVAKQVEISVNGKVDKMNLKVDDLNAKLDTHIIEHKADQEKMKPLLANFEAWSGFQKILFTVFLPIIAALSTWGGITGIADLLKPK